VAELDRAMTRIWVILLLAIASTFGTHARAGDVATTSTNSLLQARLDTESKWISENHARTPKDAKDAQEMVRILCEWAQVASFPKDAMHFQVVTAGGMFTRGFRARFVTTKESLQKWLDASVGLKGVEGKVDSGGWTTYEIKPSGGAGYAVVMIDSRISFVVVYAYWS
jgi:hypothetical protein